MLYNKSNQPYKFRTRYWVEINYDASITYNINNQIKFKTTMLQSGLCSYSDTYILVKETITVEDTSPAAAAINNAYKKSILIAYAK